MLTFVNTTTTGKPRFWERTDGSRGNKFSSFSCLIVSISLLVCLLVELAFVADDDFLLSKLTVSSGSWYIWNERSWRFRNSLRFSSGMFNFLTCSRMIVLHFFNESMMDHGELMLTTKTISVFSKLLSLSAILSTPPHEPSPSGIHTPSLGTSSRSSSLTSI